MAKALAHASRWRRPLETGMDGRIDHIANAKRINPSYVSRLPRLTLLAPELVEALMNDRQQKEVTLPGLMKGFPVERDGQRDIGRPTVVEV